MPRDGADEIQVGYLQDACDQDWDNFVKTRPQATFFHLSGWKAVVEESLKHVCFYLVARQAAKIVGVLPLTYVRSSLFGSSLMSNGFCVYGGPLAESSAALNALDGAAIELAKELKVERIEYRLRHPLHADWHCNRETYVTFRKQIESDPVKELAAIPRKQRAMVRKGIKHGLTAVVDPDVRQLYPMYAESVRNLGTPVFGRRYFECLHSIFAKESQVITAKSGGTPPASVLSFFFRDEVLPYYGGGCSAAREYAANDFMYWEVMRRAADRGFRGFDFGRSKVGTGAFAFKHNWGFPDSPLHYRFKLAPGASIPDHNPMNPKYKMFIAAWKKLPLPVANTVGPFIVRGLG